jgi:hypothetical protein
LDPYNLPKQSRYQILPPPTISSAIAAFAYANFGALWQTWAGVTHKNQARYDKAPDNRHGNTIIYMIFICF